MIHESKKQVAELPDREEISLCEAVTAVIFGGAINVKEYGRRDEKARSKIESESLLEMFDRPTSANKQIVPDEQSPANAKLNDLLERMRAAAYAGRIKFRAIRDYANPADGLKDIEPKYFYYKPFFNWTRDEIFYVEDEQPTLWSCVHLDRDQFQSLLREMGLELRDDVDPTGLPGRPSFVHLVMPEAESRLNAERHPKGISAFSRELATWFEQNHKLKRPLRPRSIENALRERWHEHQKVCTK